METKRSPSAKSDGGDKENSPSNKRKDEPSTPVKSSSAAAASAANPSGLPSAVDFEPPLACVRRILKHSLPGTTNVGKDASTAFTRASGIFIIYLTACANDFARENRRQTITANDVLAAVKELDFGEFTPDMQDFLANYRKTERSKKEARLKAAAAKKEAEEENSTIASIKGDDVDTSMDLDGNDDDNDNEEELHVNDNADIDNDDNDINNTIDDEEGDDGALNLLDGNDAADMDAEDD